MAEYEDTAKLITEAKYHELFEKIVNRFLIDFEVVKHPYNEFVERTHIRDADDMSEEDIILAIIRDHRSVWFANIPFPEEIFSKILLEIHARGKGIYNKDMLQRFVTEYNSLKSGSRKKAISIEKTMAESALQMGQALHNPDFSFAYWKTIASQFGKASDAVAAAWTEHHANMIMNRNLFGHFLPEDLVDALMNGDEKYGRLMIKAVTERKSIILEYPPNATEDEREEIAKKFEEEHIKTKLTRRKQ